MVSKTLYSSERHHWETPRELFDRVSRAVGGFTLDAAASEANHLCDVYYDENSNGLELPWHHWTWINPPYGRGIKDWTRKAAYEGVRGVASVLLIPARTDTQYFQECFKTAEAILFLAGRLKFTINGEPQGTAPFPSALIFHGALPNKYNRLEFLEPLGKLVLL